MREEFGGGGVGLFFDILINFIVKEKSVLNLVWNIRFYSVFRGRN